VGEPGANAFKVLSDLLSIGQFSRHCRLPVSPLRYYHQIGLLSPTAVDPGSGYRYYSVEQLQTSVVIADMRALGSGPETIRRVLEGGPRAQLALGAERERLRNDLKRREAALDYVEGALTGRSRGDVTSCEFVNLPKRHAVTISGEVEADNVVEQVKRLVASARQEARRYGHVAVGPVGALFPFDPASQTMTVTAFVPVAAALAPVPLPEGPAATVTYRGAIPGVILAYQVLLDRIEQRSMRVLEPLMEEYLTEDDRLAVRLSASVAA
jgi:DNA-binding transcriptional MerR regulator